jgi:hypothetical protein
MGTGAERIDFNSATLAELLQVIGVFGQSVPVTLNGPARVQSLPTRGGATRNFTSDATTKPVTVAQADPRRAELQVWCTGAPIYIGFDGATVAAGNAAILPVGQVWRTRCTDAVSALSTLGAAVISMTSESWTD